MAQITAARPQPMPAQRLTPMQIAAAARARGYDSNAVLAVARQEGLGGGIGDGGHAYGPFQLNNAGGVITGQYGGRVNDSAVQDWAWSPQGVKFALDRMGFAKGLHGRDAIAAIVNRFERPANPGREIAGANAAYGTQPGPAGPSLAAALGGGRGSAPAAAAPAAAPAPDFRAELARGLASAAGSSTNDLSGFYATLHQALQARAAAPQPTAAAAAGAPRAGLAHETPSSPIPVGATGIAKTALTQLGTPYQWGGKAALGSRTDCSGLLQASARANGISIGRTTYEQYRQGSPVALNKLQPGDAVFSEPTRDGPGHVAIYIGDGRVVEDPHTGATVRISTLAGRRGIVGARRYG